jgi:cyclin-dependent kinase-like
MAELIDGEPLFPGENEIDQIYLIMRVFGPLTGRQQQALWRNFRGVCFPPIRQVQTLEMRYAGRVGVEEMRFMKGCLRLEPEERMTAEEALGHPYLLGGSMASNNMGVIGNASINMNMNMAEMMMRES